MILAPTKLLQDEYTTKPTNKGFFSYSTPCKVMSIIVCPKCKSRYCKVVVIKQENVFMLRTRSWVKCDSCGYNKEANDFKKELHCR